MTGEHPIDGSDILKPIVERCLDILQKHGFLPKLPDELANLRKDLMDGGSRSIMESGARVAQIEADIAREKATRQLDDSAKAYDVWWQRFYAEHRETPTSLESWQAGVAWANKRESIAFPKHKASLHLEHNQHKDYYLTVAQSIEKDDHGYRADDWVSQEQKEKAIATNECWTLQWYPNSPIGFNLLSSADLDVLLTAAMLNETEGDGA